MMKKGSSTSRKGKNVCQGNSLSVKLGVVSADEEQLQESPTSGCSDDDQTITKPTKRIHNEGEVKDFSSEMQKMLECFGADISKTLTAKRKRLEAYTQNSLKTSNRKVEEFWKNQHADRKKLTDEFKQQIMSFLTQWETDVEKSKEQEDKLQNLFKQQQKLFQQTRIVQTQRLKTIHQLHERFIKEMEDLEKVHMEQQNNVHAELRKEMILLQKKILLDTQQQEMMNVRKSLQTMLF